MPTKEHIWDLPLRTVDSLTRIANLKSITCASLSADIAQTNLRMMLLHPDSFLTFFVARWTRRSVKLSWHNKNGFLCLSWFLRLWACSFEKLWETRNSFRNLVFSAYFCPSTDACFTAGFCCQMPIQLVRCPATILQFVSTKYTLLCWLRCFTASG